MKTWCSLLPALFFIAAGVSACNQNFDQFKPCAPGEDPSRDGCVKEGDATSAGGSGGSGAQAGSSGQGGSGASTSSQGGDGGSGAGGGSGGSGGTSTTGGSGGAGGSVPCESGEVTCPDGSCLACDNAPHADAACIDDDGDNICVNTCDSGWDDCDGNPMNGCELSVNNDSANCGGCGVSCGSNPCIGGACQIPCGSSGEIMPWNDTVTAVCVEGLTFNEVPAGHEVGASVSNAALPANLPAPSSDCLGASSAPGADLSVMCTVPDPGNGSLYVAPAIWNGTFTSYVCTAQSCNAVTITVVSEGQLWGCSFHPAANGTEANQMECAKP